MHTIQEEIIHPLSLHEHNTTLCGDENLPQDPNFITRSIITNFYNNCAPCCIYVIICIFIFTLVKLL